MYFVKEYQARLREEDFLATYPGYLPPCIFDNILSCADTKFCALLGTGPGPTYVKIVIFVSEILRGGAEKVLCMVSAIFLLPVLATAASGCGFSPFFKYFQWLSNVPLTGTLRTGVTPHDSGYVE